MKKIRVFQGLSLFFNLLIVGAVVYPAVLLVKANAFKANALFFPIDASLLLGLLALVTIGANIYGLVQGKKLHKVFYILKLAGTVTSLTALVLGISLAGLGATTFSALFGGFSFTNPLFFFNLIVPALALVSSIFFDHSEEFKFPACLFAAIPTLLYVLAYVINGLAKIVPVGGGYDWYELLTGEILGFILLAIYVLAACVWAVLICLFNKLLNKAFFKEEVTEKPVEETPIKEESAAEEEVSPEAEVEPEPAPEVEVEPEPIPEEASKAEVESEPEPVEEKKEEPAPIEEKPAVEAAPVVAAAAASEKPATKKAEPKKAAPKATKKPEAKKETPAKKVEEKKPTSKEGPTKVYHLTKRKEDDKWAITFVGGQKAVKLFKTKKEAEEYLATLTKNQGATALIRNSKGAKAGKFASSIKSEDIKD